jgi:hypothetical protein
VHHTRAHAPLSQSLSEEICYSIFSDHIVHMCTGGHHSSTELKATNDARLAPATHLALIRWIYSVDPLVRGRRQSDDGSAVRTNSCAADKVNLGI